MEKGIQNFIGRLTSLNIIGRFFPGAEVVIDGNKKFYSRSLKLLPEGIEKSIREKVCVYYKPEETEIKDYIIDWIIGINIPRKYNQIYGINPLEF